MPLMSPRRIEMDAWKSHALANLKVRDRFTHVGSVMISAMVLLGPAEFFARFNASSAEAFKQMVGPDRSTLFANSRRIPTEAAIACLKTAQQLRTVYKAYENSREQEDKLFHALQTALASDVICAFRRIDGVDHIRQVVRMVCAFASWTMPKELLLGCNTLPEGVAVMAEMYECAPTQREENAQVARSMLEHAGTCASSAWDATKQIARAFQAAPAAPAAPAPPETEWPDVLFEFGLQAAGVWFWMLVVYHVCLAWIDGLRATLPLPPLPADEAEAAYLARPPCTWDVPALVCVSVHAVWRGKQSTHMLILTVALLSLQCATAWPWIAYTVDASFHEIDQCRIMYKVAQNNTASKYCDDRIPLTLLATFWHSNTALCMWMAYLLDVCTQVVVHIHNTNIVRTDDMIFHQAYCFNVCTVYVVTQSFIAPYAPVQVTLAVNSVLFVLLWALTYLPSRVGDDPHWTTRVSLCASRYICVFIVTAEWFLYMKRGYVSWATDALAAVFGQVCIFNTNLFALFVAVRLYNTLRPDRKVHCMLTAY